MIEKDREKLADLRESLELTYGKNAFVPRRLLAAGKPAAKVRPKAPDAAPAAATPATAARGRKESLEEIRADLGECGRCKLSKTRTHIVFGEGNPKAEIMFVGEGPGEQEDLQGRPFVGRAGQLLDKIIEAMGLKRGDVYIANVVKCRPPGNRVPEPDEVAACEPYLFRQIETVAPKIVVALGGTALKALLHDEDVKITKARGHFLAWRGVKLMPTFHPSFLLRNPPAKKEVWEDMKKVLAELGKKAPKGGAP
jgi:DNA polymerase